MKTENLKENKSFFDSIKQKLGLKNNNFFSKLQFLGKAMVFPIIVLPIAAIFLRLGTLMSDTSLAGINEGNFIWYTGQIFIAIGGPAFENLPVIFAIGLGFGLCEDHRGEAALSAAIAVWVLQALMGENVFPTIFYNNVMIYKPKDGADPLAKLEGYSQLLYMLKNDAPIYSLDLGVFGGLLVGGITAWSYNKWHKIKMPAYLSFMEGRRFIPVVSVLLMIPLSIVFAVIWPWIQLGLFEFGIVLVGWGYIGTFLHTLLKSFLVLFGLHNVLNTFLWFQLPITGEALFTTGDFIAGQTYTVNGDINAFLSGINGSGIFQIGAFPEIMGGYWGITLAIIFCAKKENRKEVMSLMLSICLASSLTGVGEPLILPIWYASPAIYFVQSIINAIFGTIPAAMGIRAGFGFSAGWINYLISFWTSWKMAQLSSVPALANPIWLMPIAALTAAAYYVTFMFIIKKFDIKPAGREEILPVSNKSKDIDLNKNKLASELIKIIGKENVLKVDNCVTRLRLTVNDNSNIDIESIKKLKVYGVKLIGKNNIQVIIGSGVEEVTNEFARLWKQ